MRDLGLDPGQLGHITFQQLFPQLTQTAVNVPAPLALQRQTYYYRLRAPTRTHVKVPAPAPAPTLPAIELPFASQREGEKMVRLLNAGIALCIEGETGCGKEFVSRTLHQHSRWRDGKFVAINCAAIPESLIESELFGYQPAPLPAPVRMAISVKFARRTAACYSSMRLAICRCCFKPGCCGCYRKRGYAARRQPERPGQLCAYLRHPP